MNEHERGAIQSLKFAILTDASAIVAAAKVLDMICEKGAGISPVGLKILLQVTSVTPAITRAIGGLTGLVGPFAELYGIPSKDRTEAFRDAIVSLGIPMDERTESLFNR